MKTLNSILRDLREDHDMKQETVARYLGVSQQTYSNYENGRREIPVGVVKKLAQFYKVSTDYLLRLDTAYPGSLDMNAAYIDNLTVHDVIHDMQELNENERRDLIKYLLFLRQYYGKS